MKDEAAFLPRTVILVTSAKEASDSSHCCRHKQPEHSLLNELSFCFLPDRAAGKQASCCRSFPKVPGDLLANQLYSHRRQPWVSQMTEICLTVAKTVALLQKESSVFFSWSYLIFLLFCILFAESTDDDKVVAWLWEEIKGPLREEKVSANTSFLTLTNLVPGNYTFR